uniref:Histone-lysine N-methyltransferase, H3 lysine-79 specific n=1 Tax=Syphacia muris TaxID=451379 RepID=A0A158R4C6_9BILA
MGTENEQHVDDNHDEPVPSTSTGRVSKEVSKDSEHRTENRKSPTSGGSSRSTSKSRTPMRLRENGIPMKLLSPVAGESFTYYWPLRESPSYSEGGEIIETIRDTLSWFPELQFVFKKKDVDIDKIDRKSYTDMNLLMEKYNEVISIASKLWKGATKPGGEIWSTERADSELLKRIRNRAYNRAVENVNLLNNHYKAFSSETYGETSFERLQLIIQEITPKERDIFVDLGSGVGQLVVQMAGGSKVKKAVGIEIAQVPNRYAQNLADEFRKWMKWYGKKFRPFELHHGDFLDMKYRDLIVKDATIIFINNYAFTAELETRIKREILAELKDGTRIISTKPYGQTNRTLTDRHMNDISAILDMYEMAECENACSWTSNYVAYYHHTINRARLEYFFFQRNPALKSCNGSDGRRSSTSSKASRESSVSAARAGTPSHGNGHIENNDSGSKNPDDDKNTKGPTTRSRWQEYVSSKSHVSKKAKLTKEQLESGGGTVRKRDSNGDADYVPPTTKKYKKTTGVRGRPRKIAIPLEEHNESLGNLQNLNQNVVVQPSVSQETDPPLSRTEISSPSYSSASPITQTGVTPPYGVQPSKYPGLDQALELVRSYYEGLLDMMYNNKEDYLARVKVEIDDQLAYRNALLARKEGLERSINALLSMGVTRLRLRLQELNIEASCPAHLLERAKEIVEHHKKITATCAAMESEITSLELANQQLESKSKELDTSSNAGFISPDVVTNSSGSALSSSELYAAEKNQMLRNFKNSLNKVDTLAAMAESSVATTLQSRTALSSPHPETPNHMLAAANSSTFPSNTVSTQNGKRTRSRSSRGNATSKRVTLNVNKQVADPVNEEEVERTIKNIVAKALEVCFFLLFL